MSKVQDLQFGTYLSQLREHADLSMNALADLADVNVSYISRIERGAKIPSYEIIKKLYPHLNASLIEMLIKAGRLPEDVDLLDDETRVILENITPAKRKILELLNQLDDQTVTLFAQTLQSLLTNIKNND